MTVQDSSTLSIGRLVIVSNRLPAQRGEDTKAGGLTVGLRAALSGVNALWFGWSGRTCESSIGKIDVTQDGRVALASTDLRQEEYAGYYAGFSNRTLWPLLHSRLDFMRFSRDEFRTYLSVNQRFARSLAPHLHQDDLIWVHDYHLMAFGEELSQLGLSVPNGFFLHVPFPPPEIFAALPCHIELARSLTAYSLLGFQTENDKRNFVDYLCRFHGAATWNDGTLSAHGRRFKVGTFPISIDTSHLRRSSKSTISDGFASRWNRWFSDRLCIVGVDRLDYTKGLTYRLGAFERLLELSPEFRRRAFLLQIAAPSREDVPEYIETRNKLEAASGRLNARYAEFDWVPVRFLNRVFSHNFLSSIYRMSRIGMVTPLRDGMNLVAKEYVAAQNEGDPGVLILSQFAGAAEKLTGALLVNPYDIDGVASAIKSGLTMPLAERKARWTQLFDEIQSHDIHAWKGAFLTALRRSPQDHQMSLTLADRAPTQKLCRTSSTTHRGRPVNLLPTVSEVAGNTAPDTQS